MALLGYARVSTPDQSLEPQLDALRTAGCSVIFQDHGVSGGSTSRSGLDKLMHTLETGDTLVVWRLDRLGRSIRHLLEVVGVFRDRGIELRSLTENIDTSSASGRMVLHVMAAVAEFERALVSERTIAGLKAARARGKRPGRQRSLTDDQCADALRALREGATEDALAAHYNVHRRTLQRAIHRLRAARHQQAT